MRKDKKCCLLYNLYFVQNICFILLHLSFQNRTIQTNGWKNSFRRGTFRIKLPVTPGCGAGPLSDLQMDRWWSHLVGSMPSHGPSFCSHTSGVLFFKNSRYFWVKDLLSLPCFTLITVLKGSSLNKDILELEHQEMNFGGDSVCNMFYSPSY